MVVLYQLLVIGASGVPLGGLGFRSTGIPSTPRGLGFGSGVAQRVEVPARADGGDLGEQSGSSGPRATTRDQAKRFRCEGSAVAAPELPLVSFERSTEFAVVLTKAQDYRDEGDPVRSDRGSFLPQMPPERASGVCVRGRDRGVAPSQLESSPLRLATPATQRAPAGIASGPAEQDIHRTGLLSCGHRFCVGSLGC